MKRAIIVKSKNLKDAKEVHALVAKYYEDKNKIDLLRENRISFFQKIKNFLKRIFLRK